MTSTDRRKSVLLIAIFTAVWVGIWLSVGVFGWLDTWSILIAQEAVEQPFYDMWTVKTALETAAMGLNPQLENPSHPAGIVMNYPSVWLSVGEVFGLQDNGNFIVFTSVVVVAFLLCCVVLLWKFPSIWLLCCLLSGAVLYAVERGNNDLVVFSLLFLATTTPPFFRIIPVLAATLMKLYPVLVLPVFCRRPVELSIALVGCGVVLWHLSPEFDLIRSGNNAASLLAYGNLSVKIHLEDLIEISYPTVVISVALVASGIICGMILSHHRYLDPVKKSEFHEQLFYIGSCLFLGTFLLGNNNIYRLIVLIFCVPHVLSMQNRILSYTAVSCLLVVLNSVYLHWIFEFPGSVANVGLEIVLFLFLSTALMHLMRRDLPWLDRILKLAVTDLSKRPKPT